MGDRIEIAPELLEYVNGGALGFNPEAGGTYTMIGQFTGKTFSGVSLANVMEICKYAANIPNTLEGEEQIIAYAIQNHYINP